MTQLRYVITRPCLLEGSLTIAKYLRPLFPLELAGKALSLRDDQGRDYSVRMTISGGSLVGMGSVYQALHFNVNDVLLIERVGTAEYRVEGVTKPYSRPQGPAQYGSHVSQLPQRRVVVSATPHVREVRLERDYDAYGRGDYGAYVRGDVTPLPAEASEVTWQESEADLSAPAEPLPAASEAPAVRVDALRLHGDHLELPSEAQPSQPSKVEAVRPSGRIEARLDGERPAGYLGRRAPARKLPSERLAATQITAVRQGDSRPNFREDVLRAEAERASTKPTSVSELRDGPDAREERPAARLADVLLRGTGAAPAKVEDLRVAGVGADLTGASERPSPPDEAAEQLEELARLTGYQLEYLGGPGVGPVRLHADLGPHSYDIVLALNEAELRSPAFQQGQYNALLTWEVENVSGVRRLTREALAALLEHARLAPLTPIDLRGYWNTPSFDLNSVASVAELVSSYLAQRGTFTYVLSLLSQQPAHSLVDPQRLSERLGSGVSVSELRAALETLSRPPFMALLPLPGGQYYLRAEVGEVLSELSTYAAGVARRLPSVRRSATH